MTQYTEGFAAALNDYPNNRSPNNPYPKYSAESMEWLNGYWDGWNHAFMKQRWSGSNK